MRLWVSTAAQEVDTASPTEQKSAEELGRNQNQQATELLEQGIYRAQIH